MNMLDGASQGGMANSQNPFNPGSNPFGGINPFEMMNSMSETKMEKPVGGLNVDDLVKKIDAKIAELEKEEQEEKERLLKQQKEEQEEKAKQKEEKKKEEPKVSESLSNIAPTKLTGFIENTKANQNVYL